MLSASKTSGRGQTRMTARGSKPVDLARAEQLERHGGRQRAGVERDGDRHLHPRGRRSVALARLDRRADAAAQPREEDVFRHELSHHATSSHRHDLETSGILRVRPDVRGEHVERLPLCPGARQIRQREIDRRDDDVLVVVQHDLGGTLGTRLTAARDEMRAVDALGAGRRRDAFSMRVKTEESLRELA